MKVVGLHEEQKSLRKSTEDFRSCQIISGRARSLNNHNRHCIVIEILILSALKSFVIQCDIKLDIRAILQISKI